MHPTLMYEILGRLGVKYRRCLNGGDTWPYFGLARIQWGGPWTKEGVPMRVRYRHTHWVASWKASHDADRHMIFDVNATCVGWIGFFEWSHRLVPWLLKECEPKADGTWWVTHALEVQPPPLSRKDLDALIARSSLGAPFAEPDPAELDIAMDELRKIGADKA